MTKRKKEKRVPVLLLEDITRVGNRGEIKKIKIGLALFLLRKQQALIINPKKLKDLSILQKLTSKKIERKAKIIEEKKRKVENLNFRYALKVGKHGEVYDSLTKEKIRKFLQEHGIEINKDSIILGKPIKEKGDYEIEINLGLGEKTALKVTVDEEKI